MSVSYDSFVNDYHPSISQQQLEKECEYSVQLALSEKMTKWDDVGPHLLGKKWEQLKEVIDCDEQGVKGKNRGLLRLWKQHYGSKATYEELIRALLSAGRTDLAEVVWQAVGES